MDSSRLFQSLIVPGKTLLLFMSVWPISVSEYRDDDENPGRFSKPKAFFSSSSPYSCLGLCVLSRVALFFARRRCAQHSKQGVDSSVVRVPVS